MKIKPQLFSHARSACEAASQLNKFVLILLRGRHLRGDSSSTPGPPVQSIFFTRSDSRAVRRQLTRSSLIGQRVQPSAHCFAAPAVGCLPVKALLVGGNPRDLQPSHRLSHSPPEPPRISILTRAGLGGAELQPTRRLPPFRPQPQSALGPAPVH